MTTYLQRKAKKKTTMYVDNAQFYEEMKIYKAALLVDPETRVTNSVAKYIWLIAEHLSQTNSFNGYSFREDLVMDGVENALKYIHNYDADKFDKPFAYFNRIIYFAFLRRIAAEKKELYIRYKSTANKGMFNDVISDEELPASVEMYDNIIEFIQTFESKKKEKEAKKPKKAKGLDQFIEDVVPTKSDVVVGNNIHKYGVLID